MESGATIQHVGLPLAALFRKVLGVFQNLYVHTRNSALQSFSYSEPRVIGVGLIAIIAFPLYGVIWKYWFPQPYENFTLRAIGMFLFVPFALFRHLPIRIRRFFPLFWYLTLVYALPFFFTFMLLKNGLSDIWLMSTLAALFLMFLVMDWINILIMSVLGASLAWIAYLLTTEAPVGATDYLQQLPVYVFVIVVGSFLNRVEEQVKQEKQKAMLAVVAEIAHELRTPLGAIHTYAWSVERYLPALLEGYESALERGLPLFAIRPDHLESMHKIPANLRSEVNYSNAVIDTLLVSAGRERLEIRHPVDHDMAGCVERALGRYPFNPPGDRGRVVWPQEPSFRFRGSDALLMQVLFNLLKNALFAIKRVERGGIEIRLERGWAENRLRFRDTATGIAPIHLPHLFDRFYSADRGGTGLGLYFCRLAMEAMGGRIECRSEQGSYTEFTLHFPRVAAHGSP